jgi:hypothetical protein
MARDFQVYEGKWPCKICSEVVLTLRLWPDSGDVTWMCTQKHLSKMNLIPPKKKKKDFKDE